MHAASRQKQDEDEYNASSSLYGHSSTHAATDDQQAKRNSSMSSRDQLRFMQSWGERRQVIWSQDQHESSSDESEQFQLPQQHSKANGVPVAGLTFVPISAWEGLSVEEIALGKSSLNQKSQLVPVLNEVIEEEAEAPLLAQLARTDQRSEESAASVQSFCGGATGSADSQDNQQRQPPMLREPGEVAALLRNIRCGQRHLYADDDYALRLEQDILSELHIELDRQNRLDARLKEDRDCDMPATNPKSVENFPSDIPCQERADTTETERSDHRWTSSQQKKDVSKRRKSRWIVGLSSLITSRLRPPGPTLKESGEPAGGLRPKGVHRVTTDSSSYSSEEEHFFGDEIKHRRHQQRCRWRRSRAIRTSLSASPVSGVQQRQVSNRNSSNAMSDDSLLNDDEVASVNFLEANRSVPVKRVTNATHKKADQLETQLSKISFKSTDKLDYLEMKDGSLTGKVSKTRKSPAAIFEENKGVPGYPVRKRKDELIRMRSQLFEKDSLREAGVGSVPEARHSVPTQSSPQSVNRNFNRETLCAFIENPPVDNEPKRIDTVKRSVSTVSGEISDASDPRLVNVGEVRGGKKFMTCMYDRLSSASIKTFSNRLTPPPHDQMQNRNDSNHLGATRIGSMWNKDPEEVMVARHNTEPHFTSENGVESAVASVRTTCWSDTTRPSSQRILVRRRCRQVVLIHPQLVHWDLQLRQVVANPKARKEVVEHRTSSSDSMNSNGTDNQQIRSRQSLPTVTSRNVIFLSDSRFRPTGSSGHHLIVHYARLGTLKHHRPAVAHVKRVKTRCWRVGRTGRQMGTSGCPVQRNISHCTEVVDNPSLASHNDGDIHRFTLSQSQSRIATPISTSTMGDLSAGACSGSGSGSNYCSSSRTSSTSNSYSTQSCKGVFRDTVRYVDMYNSTQCRRSHSKVGVVAGDETPKFVSKRKIRAASEARTVEEPSPAEQALVNRMRSVTVEQLHRLQHQSISTNNMQTSAGEQTWLFAKRTRHPKSGYSHIVQYLPSVKVAKNGVSATRCNLLIACELTVGRSGDQPAAR